MTSFTIDRRESGVSCGYVMRKDLYDWAAPANGIRRPKRRMGESNFMIVKETEQALSLSYFCYQLRNKYRDKF
jgi:hypothetical protein